jgi:hypothetical protein
MKERLDKILRIFIIVYSWFAIGGIFANEYPSDAALENIVLAVTFPSCVQTNFLDACTRYETSYYQFVLLALVITIRYLIYGKTYQK